MTRDLSFTLLCPFGGFGLGARGFQDAEREKGRRDALRIASHRAGRPGARASGGERATRCPQNREGDIREAIGIIADEPVLVRLEMTDALLSRVRERVPRAVEEQPLSFLRVPVRVADDLDSREARAVYSDGSVRMINLDVHGEPEGGAL